jgi:HAD superfamily hydrolase (TIGR01484 family)
MPDPLLICTDLDRTLIPNGPQPESPGARRRFAELTDRPEVTLVYVSGRHRALVEEAIATYRLPLPDFVIGDVGTTIYRVGEERSWQHLTSWEDQIARDWGGHSHGDLLALLKNFPVLRMQELSKQNRLKLSYYLPLYQDIDKLSAEIRPRLEAAGVQARLVWSVDDIADIGLLDVLPAGASKRHAIEALMREQGFDLLHTVFCGDSGNDMEVLISPIPSVLVANSRAEVKRLARELATEAKTEEYLYVAEGGVLGMNGNYSAGMLEGIAHYHPHITDWLSESAAGPGMPSA